MLKEIIKIPVGILKWTGKLLHDMFFVTNDHPMTQQEFDRWQAGRLLSELPWELHRAVKEERRHQEVLEAIRDNKRF